MPSKSSWPSQGIPYRLLKTPSPTLLPMSPESMHSYLPHPDDDAVPAQDLRGIPTSGWYAASAPAPDQNQTGYAPYGYDQPYVTPHTGSIGFPPQQFPKTTDASAVAKREPTSAFSPAPHHSRMSEQGQPEFGRPTERPYMGTPRTSAEPSTHFPAHIKVETNPPPHRPHSSPSSFTANDGSSVPADFNNWTMNPLGISTTMHEQYYTGPSYPPIRPNSSQWDEQPVGPPNSVYSPQPRRMYTPIAPHPLGPHRTSVPKRTLDDDEHSDDSKRRKRSDSNTTLSRELREEDRLLLQLKEEENMPWKEIAARFESDLGEKHQIPALQMRINRLKKRMRVWTEADITALRMAHNYWVDSKFEIISQKMLEYGVQEKWDPKQCSRKLAELDPGPTPYSTYEHQSTVYMSPVEAPSFIPYP